MEALKAAHTSFDEQRKRSQHQREKTRKAAAIKTSAVVKAWSDFDLAPGFCAKLRQLHLVTAERDGPNGSYVSFHDPVMEDYKDWDQPAWFLCEKGPAGGS